MGWGISPKVDLGPILWDLGRVLLPLKLQPLHSAVPSALGELGWGVQKGGSTGVATQAGLLRVSAQ